MDGSGDVVPADSVRCIFCTLGVACRTVADGSSLLLERFINDSNVKDNEPGGTFTMGGFLITRAALWCGWLTRVPQDSSTAVCTLARSITRTFPERQVSGCSRCQVRALFLDFGAIVTSLFCFVFVLAAMTVQGKSITLPSGSSAYAAIDTGTTLVGGPSSAIQNIFAQIPGSAPGTGSWDGYYTYRGYFRRPDAKCAKQTRCNSM